MPECCHCNDISHSKLCCDHTDSDGQSVNTSSLSLSLSDTRSDYISSDLSEGLSLSDTEEKPSQENTNLEPSTSSQMYHHAPNQSFQGNDDTRLSRKSRNFHEEIFSTGIIPFKESEHLDTNGTPSDFECTTSPSAQENISSIEPFFDQDESRSLHNKQVNKQINQDIYSQVLVTSF